LSKVAKQSQPHIKPLVDLVIRWRESTGFFTDIPHFDPDDGGVRAKVLWLKEAPGPSAIQSGFVAPENSGPTAANMRWFREQVPIENRLIVNWNHVPWYLSEPNGRKIRPPTRLDRRDGAIYLKELLPLIPKLEVVVLIGTQAQKGWTENSCDRFAVETLGRSVRVIRTWHPSPTCLNRGASRRAELLDALRAAQGFVRD
jgi:hypothetical protein